MFKQAILIIFLSFLCCTVVRAQENPIAWKGAGLLYLGEIEGNIIGIDGWQNFWISSDKGISWSRLSHGLWRDGTMPDYGFRGGVWNDALILYNSTKVPYPWEHEFGRGFYYLSIKNKLWDYIKLPQESYDSVSLRSITTLNKDTMFAWFRVHSKSKLYRTTDHGTNWEEITANIPGGSYVNSLTSTDEERLVMKVYLTIDPINSYFETILFSDDYGESWQRGGNGLPDSCKLTVVAQDIDGDAVYSVSKKENGYTKLKGLYITTDDYQTFRKFSLAYFGMSDSSFSFRQIQLIDSMLFVTFPLYDSLGGDIANTTYFSLDTGRSWKVINDPDTIFRELVTILRFQNGYIVRGGGYHRLEHIDSIGEKLTFGPVVTGRYGKITVVSGSDMSLTRTSDNSYVQTTSYTSISHDDGLSWEMKKDDSVSLSSSKWHVSDNVMYAPGVKDSNACIFTSSDNGDSWLPLSYIVEGAEAHWLQVSHDTIVALLSPKQVYASINNGASWREITDTLSPLLASIEPIYTNGKVFCASQDRREIVSYSFASGEWDVVTLPNTLPLYGQYSGGVYCDGKLYMFTNYYGYDTSYVPLSLVYRSDDLGETWNIFDTGLPDTAYVSSYTVNDNTLYAIVSEMKKGEQPDINLHYLGKGNDAWQSTSISSYLPSEVYASDSYVYLKNDRGLFRYPQFSVSVSDGEHISTNTFDIYPNPASTSVTIRQGKFGAISYICTDIAGKMYQFGELPKLSDEVKIDIRSLPDGSYTLRLQNADGEVASRRFVVVK